MINIKNILYSAFALVILVLGAFGFRAETKALSITNSNRLTSDSYVTYFEQLIDGLDYHYALIFSDYSGNYPYNNYYNYLCLYNEYVDVSNFNNASLNCDKLYQLDSDNNLSVKENENLTLTNSIFYYYNNCDYKLLLILSILIILSSIFFFFIFKELFL